MTTKRRQGTVSEVTGSLAARLAWRRCRGSPVALRHPLSGDLLWAA